MFPSLNDLIILDCKSLRISGGAFRNLDQSKSLSLPRNELSQLPHELLEGLSSLQNIDLSGNRLVEVHLNRLNLKTLDLFDNPLLDVSLSRSSIDEVYMENLSGLLYSDSFNDKPISISLPQNFHKT